MGLFGAKHKRSDAQLHQLLDDAHAGSDQCVRVLLRRTDLYPVYISPNFRTMLGVDPQRYIDDVHVLLRHIPAEEQPNLRRAVKAWDRTGKLSQLCAYDMPGNQPVRKHFRITTTPTANGEHYLVEFIDVTEEQQAIEQACAERDRALQIVEGRSSFMSQMSHEIRTPLNGIKGIIELARDHSTEPELLLDDLQRADELSAYLLSLINDVLDMSRLNSGHVELEALPFDMRLVARELQSMFEKQAQDAQIDYRVEMDGCDDVLLVGDRMRLNQVIVNFISNALKFTDAGGSVIITIREMYRNERTVNYLIRVRDTGKGMDPRYISRIFLPFEQEDRTIARRYGGTGLGMAITDALVDLMGGTIVVDTEPGKGSDFTANIPFKLADAKQVEQLEQEGETLETRSDDSGTPTEYEFAGKRFLLAEDNDLNAMIAAAMLEDLDVAVDRADDGPVVVDMFEKSAIDTYDAILMDIQMPTFNGWEATRRIRALERHDAQTVPIIALSANNYVEDARESRKAGMNGHTGKPIEIAELKAQLAAATAESALSSRR
ncbi:ATP-binding protein [uncultured Senegalimassilia sp.]|uniref:ATP-binding protein n=1 Tax=uncultured Senegalimassilia sp. TaxID=1714350 RepID=UPI0025ED7E66|nr:ATP-binding protein [uncultured Senegalimassilia sp.]